MDGPAPTAGARPGILHRRATRRALLAGTASIAAAGTAAAIVGVAAQGGDGGSKATLPNVSADGTAPAGPTPTPTPRPLSSKTQITDPLKRAAHLLRRAGFGGTKAEIEEFAKLSKEEAANRLVDYESTSNAALDARISTANFVLRYSDEDGQRGRLIPDMQRWWLTRMAYTARPLEERMTFAWHGLLTSQVSKVGAIRARLLLNQNELFRKHALGKYDDLVQAVSKDPAMMNYLDTVDSTAAHPNENYPRELLELFTMGVGNYTETDVREASRAFTGWRLTNPPRPTFDPSLSDAEKDRLRRAAQANHTPEFQLNPRLHDNGEKTFLGRKGNLGGEDIVRIVMEQPATGRFITTRLWKEFAYADPEPEVVDRLVKTWDVSGHSIREVVRAILVSDEFYSEKAYFGKVRSPIEFLIGLVRGMELDFGFQNATADRGGRRSGYYAGMDQVLFEPPNVAGWPGGAAWLSSSTFFARVNFLDQVLFTRNRPTAIPALSSAATAEALVDAVAARLVDSGLPAESRATLAAHANTIKDPAERMATVAYLVAGSPEYQLV